MYIKKILFILLVFTLTSGCMQQSAFLGPAITAGTSGNIYQAGLTYGTNQVVTKATGKSTFENIKEFLEPKETDNEFFVTIKNQINESSKVKDLSAK